VLDKRTQLGIWTATALTTIVGVINLISAVTPSLRDRVHWLEEIFPFEVRSSGQHYRAWERRNLLPELKKPYIIYMSI
jgi:phosphatidylglycerol lysyltransferase